MHRKKLAVILGISLSTLALGGCTGITNEFEKPPIVEEFEPSEEPIQALYGVAEVDNFK